MHQGGVSVWGKVNRQLLLVGKNIKPLRLQGSCPVEDTGFLLSKPPAGQGPGA